MFIKSDPVLYHKTSDGIKHDLGLRTHTFISRILKQKAEIWECTHAPQAFRIISFSLRSTFSRLTLFLKPSVQFFLLLTFFSVGLAGWMRMTSSSPAWPNNAPSSSLQGDKYRARDTLNSKHPDRLTVSSTDRHTMTQRSVETMRLSNIKHTDQQNSFWRTMTQEILRLSSYCTNFSSWQQHLSRFSNNWERKRERNDSVIVETHEEFVEV